MLQRYKAQRTGAYTEQEKAEIEGVTALILGSALAFYPSHPLTALEKDYARYIRVSAFYGAGPGFLLAGVSFLYVDRLPKLNRLPGMLKWTLKLTSFLGFYLAGVSELKRRVYQFPLLDDVILTGVIKYTKWMEIPPDAVLDDLPQPAN